MGKMIMSPVVDAASSQQQSQPVAPRAHTSLFTLTFVGGQVALLTVSGATDAHHARTIASNAIAHCRYAVVEGDTTNRLVHSFYYWHEAQERNPRLSTISNFQKETER